MTTSDAHAEDGAVAAWVLEARLEPGPGRPIRRAVRAAGAILFAAVGAEVSDLGREAQLVVRRIDTGREVLRMDAGHLVEADQVLQRARLDLETRSERDFVAEWAPVDARPGREGGSGTGTGAGDA